MVNNRIINLTNPALTLRIGEPVHEIRQTWRREKSPLLQLNAQVQIVPPAAVKSRSNGPVSAGSARSVASVVVVVVLSLISILLIPG